MNRILDALLGPHCPHQCGERIYPRDLHTHLQLEHAGDPAISPILVDAVRETAVAAAYLRRHRKATS
jgi:hypothetical protein